MCFKSKSKAFLLIAIPIFFIACKKEFSSEIETPTLEVVPENKSVIAKRTATWCGPCGGYGFDAFESFKNAYGDKAVFMAFKDAFRDTNNLVVSPYGDDLFQIVRDLFDITSGTPRFFYNFEHEGLDASGYVYPHSEADVVVNGNYDFEIAEEEIILNTTFEFFQEVDGDYYVTPFLMLDDIIGFQNGHDDNMFTVHDVFVAGIAQPKGFEQDLDKWFFPMANGKLRQNHKKNLSFYIEHDERWAKENISFVLVMWEKVGNNFRFVNAMSK